MTKEEYQSAIKAWEKIGYKVHFEEYKIN